MLQHKCNLKINVLKICLKTHNFLHSERYIIIIFKKKITIDIR